MRINQLKKLKVSTNGRFLTDSDDIPFFWLGDTAWTIANNLKRAQVKKYFRNRTEKGFTIIQIVALDPETNENMQNAYGEIPISGKKPFQFNERYFEYLDEIIDLAGEMGLYIALLPAWGQLLTGDNWAGQHFDVLMNEENSFEYAEWIGRRYRNRNHIVWVLGGDRHPIHLGIDYMQAWRNMAEGLALGVLGKRLYWNKPDESWKDILITYHPTYSDDPPVFSSSHWFRDDCWIAFNMMQSGHRDMVRNYDQVYYDYHILPPKPIIDGEPNYEDMPCVTCDGIKLHSDWNVRKRAYWSLLAGAFGHTYGHSSIWCMIDEKRKTEILKYTWSEAMDRPGALQMTFLKNLLLSRDFFNSVPDQTLVGYLDNYLDIRQQARRGVDGRFAIIYLTSGGSVDIYLEKLSGRHLVGWWFNPRDGKVYDQKGKSTNQPFFETDEKSKRKFTSPDHGYAKDWVLVIDDDAFGFPIPGAKYSVPFVKTRNQRI